MLKNIGTVLPNFRQVDLPTYIHAIDQCVKCFKCNETEEKLIQEVSPNSKIASAKIIKSCIDVSTAFKRITFGGPLRLCYSKAIKQNYIWK